MGRPVILKFIQSSIGDRSSSVRIRQSWWRPSQSFEGWRERHEPASIKRFGWSIGKRKKCGYFYDTTESLVYVGSLRL